MSQKLKQQGSSHNVSQIKVSNSVAESTIINSEVQERQSLQNSNDEQVPSSKLKHKKFICMFVVVAFGLAYYIIQKYLKPPEVVKVVDTFDEASIQFDAILGQKYAWIRQKLDHTNPNQLGVWKQRLILDFDPNTINKTTPIFISMASFQTAKSAQNSVNLKNIVNNLKGVSICIEPRYFGQSLPFGVDSFSVNNLKYLTVEQIVEDIAYIIDRIVKQKFFKISSENPWIISGQSFAGMIAVWVRAKYPDLTAGAYVSSPIMPTALVPLVSEKQYLNALSGGKTCRTVYMRILKQFEQKVYGQKSDGLLLDMGRGYELTAEQAMYMIVNRLMMINRNAFINQCSKYTEQSLMSILPDQVYYYDYFQTDPITFSKAELTSEEQWIQYQPVRNRRAFQWLRCNQLGFFQISSVSDKRCINFKQINQTFFRQRCKQLFRQELWPNPKLKDIYSRQMKNLTKLFVTHGYYDIWLPYAFIPNTTKNVFSIILKCSFCCHNFDATINSVIFKQIDEMRTKESIQITNWISQKIKK